MLENQYERFVTYTDDQTILSQEDRIRFVLSVDAEVATLPFAAQCFPGSGKQLKLIVNDTTSSFNITVAVQSGDTIVGNVTLTPGRGCFAISDGAAEWTLIGPSGAGGSGSVVEADFSFTDITTANATSSAHGLMPKLTPGVATASQPVTLGTTKNLDTLALDALTGNDASLGITGLASTQGGAIVVTGGTSSTAGNAGGAVSLVGGTPGATGVGGGASLTGGIGGATSGAGGVASVAGGAGTNGNGNGGAVTINGGAKNGSGANGAVTIQSAYAPVAGGGTSAAILCTSTALLGVYFGTGTPTFSAAKGSLYVKTDASTSATRLFIASDAVGTWTAFTSVA